jgi:membrane associated rhomboid family serine protease
MSVAPGGPASEPGSGGGAAPTCYRHPSRPTYISCVRCERPICPDCMVQAAVGFQCPECVRDGRKSVRQAQTPFGGRATANPHAVTYALIGLNALAFLGELASSAFVNRFEQIGLAVERTNGSAHLVGVAHGEYYRLLTSMFLHEPPTAGGAFFLHILFNMWALSVVGPPLEALLGRVRFVAMYLLSGLAGSVLAYTLTVPNVAELGASGAIFGLFGALLVVGRRLRLNIQPIAITIGLNLVLTFSFAGISWQAHIGGLVAGAALGAAWAYAPRANRTAIQVGSSIALAAILIVMVILRTHNLTG